MIAIRRRAFDAIDHICAWNAIGTSGKESWIEEVEKQIEAAVADALADSQFKIQGLQRTIDEQKQLVEVLRRIEHAFGCKHVDNGPEDADNIVRHIMELVAENERLKSLDELNGRYIAERDQRLEQQKWEARERYADARYRIERLDSLLKRVCHHGPQGSSSTPLCPPGCWDDCVACEYESLQAQAQ